MNVSDLRTVVTGAASGLGRVFALSLCREGAWVAAYDVDQEGLRALESCARQLAGRLATYRIDVSKSDEVATTVKKTINEFGYINCLINNAGILRDGLLVKKSDDGVLKMRSEQWLSVIDVNLTGVFLMTREVVAHMITRGVRPGLIVNISSLSRAGNAGQGNYAATKAGVVAATKSWAQELAPHGIRVAALAPGFTRTRMLRSMTQETLDRWISRIPLGRLGEPEETYRGVKFIIECDYFAGKCLDIDGGLDM